MEDPQPLPQILSSCSSGRRRSSVDSNSPEFEFWMVRNPSFPQPNLLSADELFSDGVLLPLHHLLHLSNELPPPQPQDSEVTEPEPSSTELGDRAATSTTLSSSKRWRYIFKKSDKKGFESSDSATADDQSTKEKDFRGKDKKRDQKKNGGGGGGGGATSNLVTAAELNINIWPFSRSRSAGINGGTRPRWAAATRKSSSAPCSRSNSTGESKSRKWPNSPSRAGVHLGRSSPVWQVRRGTGGGGRTSESVVRNGEKGTRKDGTESRRKTPAAGGGPKARVLSLNVPMCIGYRHNMSCRSDENSAVSVAAAGAGGGRGVSGEGVRRSNLFNIRNLFTKKVY
ncbi:hypothetical protein Salat_2087500 [Sesamum alatum]|uniref:Uncharacterized protein n=1 Tax=Sesamum alatum TaxID=300844 RepID=A0AAE2CGN3_9LAMI|nr:hypothetical protein Salat_2087500 [Sesamum alatum]